MWFALLLFFGFFVSEDASPYRKEVINGRGGQALYRIEVPEEWVTIQVKQNEDTREPIAEFAFGNVRFLIHNFPGMRIPPSAQVERWNRQTPSRFVEPSAFSGYQGLFFENEKVLAWALEWGACRREKEENFSDVTLKVIGPEQEIEDNREAIIKAARTFENCEDLCRW